MSTGLIAEAAVSHDEYLGSVEAQIQRRLGGRVRDLRVVLRDNAVVLKGRSATYHAKQLAQHAAMEITGLRIAANDIEVC
jgi:hypothetical protein